jgi:uracil-DNA glycosylase
MLEDLALQIVLDSYPSIKEAITRDLDVLCPKKPDILKAFNYAGADNTKVVVLGQDPYHTPGKANGLAFGYHEDYTGPLDSSLKSIVEEIYRDTGQTVKDLTLKTVARQGVLLLNTVLTTVEGKAGAHKNVGWEEFTTETLEKLSNVNHPIVFMLWGSDARSYKKYIDNPMHLVLESSHPCGLSAHKGFVGCGHFSDANKFLVERNIDPVQWGELLH